MNSKVPDQLIRTIEQSSVFCLLGHADPDGDCIGSQMALANFLRRIGKRVHLYSPGPFGRAEIKEYASYFAPRIEPSLIELEPTVIILDCSSMDRIGPLAQDIAELSQIVVIDHHSSGESFGNLHYIEPAVPAVTLLVQYLIEAMGYAVDEAEARWILFGFCTDTGFFRHLDATGTQTLDAIARLGPAGASPNQAYGMIYGDRPLETRILLGRLLTRTESLYEGRLLVTHETLEDSRTFGTSNRDSDTLYQMLATVRDCEAIVFIREEEELSCTIGLRSKSTVDVGHIAKSFGGGGHTRAAGFSWSGTRDAIRQRVVELFGEIFA